MSPSQRKDKRMKILFAWMCCLLGLVQPLRAADGERPNIVFIMADDLGYAHLGCYGQTKIQTPHLDRFAAEGMRFTSAYAGAPVCAPSRSVLMTGLHAGHTPVRGNSGGIPLAPEDVTVAEVLKGAGYVTGLFGKWGLGEHGTTGVPYKQGFDEFFGYLHQIHAHFYYPEYLWQNERKYPLPGNSDGRRGQYTHDEIVSKAMDFLRSHHDEHFFLYVPFAVPHYELLVPEESLAQYVGKFPETPYEGRKGRPTGYPHDYAKQPTPKAATAAIISHMDRSVGKLLGLLKELELDDRTVVFFTSDNGATGGASDPQFFKACGPFRGRKGRLFEGGLRTPMIVRWPGKIPAGVVNDHPWYFADVLPTLAELGQTTVPDRTDGISVVPTLLGETAAGRKQAVHEFLYWEHKGSSAVRAGHWKAIRPRENASEEAGKLALYDLRVDPGETQDVAAEHPDVVARIERYLATARTEPRPQREPKKPAGRRYQ